MYCGELLTKWDIRIERRISLTLLLTERGIDRGVLWTASVCECVCVRMCLLAKSTVTFTGAGGVRPHVASESQHFAVCNTSSLLCLLAECVYELMTSGNLSSQPTIAVALG